MNEMSDERINELMDSIVGQGGIARSGGTYNSISNDDNSFYTESVERLSGMVEGFFAESGGSTTNSEQEETEPEVEDSDEFGDELNELLENILTETDDEDSESGEDTNTSEMGGADNGNTVFEPSFTLVFRELGEGVQEDLEYAISQLNGELGVEVADVILYNVLSEREQDRVLNHKIASIVNSEAVRLCDTLNSMLESVTELLDIHQGSSNVNDIVRSYLTNEMNINLDAGIPFSVDEEQDQPEVQEVEVVAEQSTTQRARSNRSSRRTTDYGLAWDIYSLGYSSGEVAILYNTSAGSITRGIKKEGHVTRTGAETRRMIKTDPDEFSSTLMARINELLEDKYDTSEERNEAFLQAFGKNIYELTLHEAEDEQVALSELREQASVSGMSLRDFANQDEGEVFVERECSEFVNKVKELHERVDRQAREIFGDVNVNMGSVVVESKVTYENGVILSIKNADKLDGKSLDAETVAFSIKMAEYITNGFQREVETFRGRLEVILGTVFGRNGRSVRVAQLGNRLVVGLKNE